ncbi:hypothetical protein Bca101_027819 [Brassica carinata]
MEESSNDLHSRLRHPLRFVLSEQRREGKERLCFIQSHTPNNLKLISERFTSSDSIPSTYNDGNRDWHRVSKGSSIAVHSPLEELQTSVSTSMITGDQFAIAKETRLKLGMGSNMCTMYPYHQLLYLDKKAIGGSLGNEVTEHTFQKAIMEQGAESEGVKEDAELINASEIVQVPRIGKRWKNFKARRKLYINRFHKLTYYIKPVSCQSSCTGFRGISLILTREDKG